MDTEHDPRDPKTRQLFLDRLTDLSHLTGLKVTGGVVSPHNDPLFCTHGYVEQDGVLQWVNLLEREK